MQDSYLQSAGYESRVLTITPRGQRDFEAKLNKTEWALKSKVFSESMLTAWYSALCKGPPNGFFFLDFFSLLIQLWIVNFFQSKVGLFQKKFWKNSKENSEKINRGDPYLKKPTLGDLLWLKWTGFSKNSINLWKKHSYGHSVKHCDHKKNWGSKKAFYIIEIHLFLSYR